MYQIKPTKLGYQDKVAEIHIHKDRRRAESVSFKKMACCLSMGTMACYRGNNLNTPSASISLRTGSRTRTSVSLNVKPNSQFSSGMLLHCAFTPTSSLSFSSGSSFAGILSSNFRPFFLLLLGIIELGLVPIRWGKNVCFLKSWIFSIFWVVGLLIFCSMCGNVWSILDFLGAIYEFMIHPCLSFFKVYYATHET